MLHVCLVTDSGYVHYTMMCIYDIMIRQNADTEITFHIIADRLTEEETHNLNKLSKLRNTTLDIMPYDASTLVKADRLHDPHLTAASFLRILFPELLKDKDITRAVYIDDDMLCRRDLTDLLSMDLKGQPLGMVRDSIYLAFSDYRTVPWRKSDTNSGLMLMDIPALNAMNFTKKMKDAIAYTSCTVQEMIDHETHDKYLTLLPPICQIPMHNFVANRFDPLRFCRLDQWNIYHNTNYESFQEIFDQTFFWHFHEDKAIYLKNDTVRSIYETSEARLAAYLDTEVQMEWTKENDASFEEPCYAVVDELVERNRVIREQNIAEYMARLNIDSPDNIAWSLYFDRIYCLHSWNKPNRLGAVYHEMRRVSMEKNSDLRYFNTQPTKFDLSVYKDQDHVLFDQLVSESSRQAKINQLIGYYQLFREMVGSGIDRVLVCEDDVVFLKDCVEIRVIMEHMPDLWDYIKFERLNGPEELKSRYNTIQEREYFHRNYTGGYLGSACCAYSRRAMQIAIQIIEEQLLRPDYILENRDDARLNDLRRYVCSKNLAVEAGRSFETDYADIADPNEYWSDAEYRSFANGGEI